jgi:hypothetical protein
MTSPDPSPIFGSVRLSEAEVRDALMGASPILRYRWVGMVASAIACVLFMPSFEGKGPQSGLDFVPIIVALTIFWTMLLLGPRTSARRILKTLGAEQGEIDYRFDADGMTIRAPGSSVTISYRVINRYRETRLTFLVYGSPGMANIVPKRAFSAAGVNEVRALLEANVRPAGFSKEGQR